MSNKTYFFDFRILNIKLILTFTLSREIISFPVYEHYNKGIIQFKTSKREKGVKGQQLMSD
jgi:hypothetical protein